MNSISIKEYAENLLKRMLNNSSAKFYDGQWEAIENALNNKRTLVIEKTGWGKSIVYFIASKLIKEKRGGVTILISPLLSLMRNQIEAAKKMGIRALTINSENEDEWKNITYMMSSGKCDIIFISPERLDNENFTQEILPRIKDGINMIVVDEAHCISEWGHDFRPDYSRIVDVIKHMAPNIPVIATTATANKRVQQDIKVQLENEHNKLHIIRGPLMRESLKIQVIKLAKQSERMAWILENINKMQGSGIIYCLTTRDCKIVSGFLRENSINALEYYSYLCESDKKENKRLREEREQLLIDNRVKVLVSTIALGMGFDKGDLGFVIHYQTPNNIISYYQEIGRAGRKINSAYAILLVGQEDSTIAKHFIENAFPKRSELESVLDIITKSKEGISVDGIIKCKNMTNKSIKKCIKMLDLNKVISKSGSKYFRTINTYNYNNFKMDEIRNIKYKEMSLMQKYIDTKECYMKFLANELDDNTVSTCGKCCNCIHDEYFKHLVQSKNVKKAEEYIKNRSIKIEPRKMWPSGVIRDTGRKILDKEQNEVGRVLADYGDFGYGTMIKEDKYNKKYFREELVDATVKLVKYKWNELDKINCVIAVPSLRRPLLVKSFAERVAKKLNVNFYDVIVKPKETAQQKTMENTNMQAKNAYNAFEVTKAFNYGNVLLIDDMVDSGWTLTVCGYKLKQKGALKVYPYALASTAKNGGDEE